MMGRQLTLTSASAASNGIDKTAWNFGFPKGKRLVDLTHVLQPEKEQYTLEVTMRGDRPGSEGDIMTAVYMWSHVGTHVEAPLHFLRDGADTSQIPIEALFGPAIVLDFRHKETNEPISREELEKAGDIQIGDRVITMTGRDNLYRTLKSHDRPYIEEEAARWLVEDRKIRCLGTDSSGFEVRGVAHYPNHRLFTQAGIPIIECLANLTSLKTQRIFFVGLPIPVIGLDASPIRAIAIEMDEDQ